MIHEGPIPFARPNTVRPEPVEGRLSSRVLAGGEACFDKLSTNGFFPERSA